MQIHLQANQAVTLQDKRLLLNIEQATEMKVTAYLEWSFARKLAMA
jgi:hypothetical protein